MGVDWYPCRLDEGVDRKSLEDAIRLSHRCFLLHQKLPEFLPYIDWSAEERDQIDHDAKSSVWPTDLLLFKYQSHRVNVIGNNRIFPAEWRIDAYRTIAPWELPDLVAKWKKHSAEIQNGKHRAYLFEWFLYESTVSLIEGYKELISLATSTESEDAKWTKNPNLIQVREEIKTTVVPETLDAPVWEDWKHRPDESCEFESDFRNLDLLAKYEQLEDINGRWNQFGRHRMQPLSSYLNFDWTSSDYSKHSQDWLQEFFGWVDPLVRQGYGLYRDC